MMTNNLNIKYNGQIDRFFDESEIEYDLACANAALLRNENIVHLRWTSENGYEVID